MTFSLLLWSIGTSNASRNGEQFPSIERYSKHTCLIRQGFHSSLPPLGLKKKTTKEILKSRRKQWVRSSCNTILEWHWKQLICSHLVKRCHIGVQLLPLLYSILCSICAVAETSFYKSCHPIPLCWKKSLYLYVNNIHNRLMQLESGGKVSIKK